MLPSPALDDPVHMGFAEPTFAGESRLGYIARRKTSADFHHGVGSEFGAADVLT
jgi:hypothetical protein